MLFAIIGWQQAGAQDFTFDGLNYNVTSPTTVEVGNQNSAVAGNVIIPAQVTDNGNTYQVTSISDSAFLNCISLTSVIIPNSVASIGNSAFNSCAALTSVNIPNSVNSIGNYAFNACSALTSATIANSVTTIGDYAFYFCSALTSVNIPNSLSIIDVGVFAWCTSLALLIIPNSVTSIGAGAFYNYSSLASVNIPNSVISIGQNAFIDCISLTSLIFPNSLTTIDDRAFANCYGLTSVNIPNSVTFIDDLAFAFCTSLTCVTVNWSTPLVINNTVFQAVSKPTVELIVPSGLASIYDATAIWTDFLINDASINVVPTFNPIPAICEGTAAPALPTTSSNVITGTWFPTTVSNAASDTYTFTPNATQCAIVTPIPITITVAPLVTPSFNLISPFCASTTAPVLPTTSINGITGTWSPATVSNTTSGIYTFTANAGQCAITTPIPIPITVTPLVTPTFNPISPFCVGSIAPVLPLTSLNGIEGTWSRATVSNTTSGTYTFTPNSAVGNCYSNQVINVNVLQLLSPDFQDIILCKNQVGYVFTDQSPNGIFGTWSPSSINFATGGNYTFIPDVGQCAAHQTIAITINSSSLIDFQWLISEPFSNQPTITILPNTAGNYLYQLDFGPQQASNIFQNVSAGFHSVQLVDLDGCAEPVIKRNILIINYPKFFTPNDDGFNDTWNISELFLQKKSKIYIYDRYGKLLKQINPFNVGWDGKYNNKMLPSDDYWFIVEFEYNNSIKQFKSHFTLKR